MPRKLSREEQETVITRASDEAEWTVYTSDPVVKRRLARITTAMGISASIVDQDEIQVRLPLTCVRFTTRTVVSAQEKAKRVESGRRLAASRAGRATAEREKA